MILIFVELLISQRNRLKVSAIFYRSVVKLLSQKDDEVRSAKVFLP